MSPVSLVILAAAEPAPPPEIPYETAGIVLVALVTGITAVITALIQRGKRDAQNNAATAAAAAATPTTISPVFVISREEWDGAISRIIKLETQFASLRTEYDYHERWTSGEVREMSNEIAYMRGKMGMPEA